MNSVELLDQKEQLQLRAENLLNSVEKEARKLNADEEVEYNSLLKQIEDTETELNNKLNDNEKRNKTMENKFSLINAINAVVNNRNLDESAQEVVNAGIAEMRKSGQSFSGQIILPVEERATIQATVATHGQETVAEDKLNILEPLRNRLVLTQAGATYMTGLVGNVSIPTYSGTNVAWKGEVAAADDGAGTFGEVELSPKRLTAYLDISKQFLIQDSVSAEEMLKNDIVRALAEKLESTILGNAVGSSTQPAGIFKLITPATGAAATYAGTVAMEKALDENNATGNFSYIVSPAVKATLRTAAKDSGSGLFTMENDEINGIPVYCTNSCAGAVVGNFEDYVIAQWGGIDLTVDPYTQASNGKVRLVINAYFDAKPRRTESFTGFVPASN